VTLEPLTRKPRNLVKRSGLFEQVASSRDDHELLFAAELWKDHPVQLDHLDIVAADDQQRGRSNAGQGWSSQIRPAASGDDGTYHVRAPGRGHEGGGRTGTCAEGQVRLRGSAAILTGRLFDDRGNRMSPTHTNKQGARYRYYVSHALLQTSVFKI
jgi:hypothetical protein